MKIFDQNCPDQLADSKHAAVIQIGGNDEKVNAGGKNQHSGNCKCDLA